MNENPLILGLWGKTDKNDPSRYHPLLYHMLDVGHAAQLIWREYLTPRIRAKIASALNLTEPQAETAIVCLAALHDLGKASPCFQNKRPDLLSRLSLKLDANTRDVPHGYISARTIQRYTDGLFLPWRLSKANGRVMATTSGGHHGTFPPPDVRKLGVETLGNNEWEMARDYLVLELFRLLEFEEATAWEEADDFSDPSILPLVAGLISVADWIGSSKYFTMAHDVSPDEYAPLSRQRALAALTDFGWLPRPVAGSPKSFRDIFNFEPNEMQSQALRLAEASDFPYLLVVENAMGTGKTELAFITADRQFVKGAPGFYTALPTQATGNAMFDRACDYLNASGHSGALNVQLIHGQALLMDAFASLMTAPSYGDKGDCDGQIVAQSWFTGNKRPLLAPFGIGTIDQSFLAALQTRHWFVRMFGLAGKVVIFDEVHAYGTYMSSLLCDLIGWLATLDCTIVLLSATLPASRRAALVDAYRPGTSSTLTKVDYPRMTWVGHDQTDVFPLAAQKNVEVAVEFLDESGLTKAVDTKLGDGGCGVVICNTVKRAQKIFEELRKKLPGWKLLLFHAQMPYAWRQSREEEVLRLFGKNGERPDRYLLISTQIVEQSLDLDFDWMISDVAPIDLLLQRLGRLHRHLRDNRPERVSSPVLSIIRPESSRSVPDFSNFGEIYEKYILLRSWLAIRSRTELEIPREIETLVDEVYCEVMPNYEISSEWLQDLERAEEEMELRRKVDKKNAKDVVIPTPRDPRMFFHEIDRTLEDDDDPNLHNSIKAATRDGAPSIRVVCTISVDVLRLVDDVEGGTAVSVDTEPDALLTRQMIKSSLSVSHRGLYHILKGLKSPASWRENCHLRYCRLLTFDKSRSLAMDGYILTLDSALGLVIEKSAA